LQDRQYYQNKKHQVFIFTLAEARSILTRCFCRVAVTLLTDFLLLNCMLKIQILTPKNQIYFQFSRTFFLFKNASFFNVKK
jgi:hypothetical protein